MNERMNNIGFHKTDGYIREVTIIEQLKRNINFRGINDITINRFGCETYNGRYLYDSLMQVLYACQD